jgi:hypothetical protein
MSALTVPVGKPTKVVVKFQDASGNPATVQGDVRWSSSDTSVATVSAQRPDTSVAVVTGVKLGNATITAAGDADLGAGVQMLSTHLDVSVSSGQAVSGTITPVDVGAMPDHGLPGGPPPHGPGSGGERPDNTLPGGPPPHGPGSGGEHIDHELPGGPPGHASTQPLPGERPHVGGGPVEKPPHASGQPLPEQPPAKPKKW